MSSLTSEIAKATPSATPAIPTAERQISFTLGKVKRIKATSTLAKRKRQQVIMLYAGMSRNTVCCYKPVFFLIILEPVTIKEAFLEWLVVGSSCFSIRFAIVFVAV